MGCGPDPFTAYKVLGKIRPESEEETRAFMSAVEPDEAPVGRKACQGIAGWPG